MDIALTAAYNNNVTIFNAMGNNLGSGIAYPANNGSLIAVGASTKFNTRAGYSNTGNHIEFLAPGGGGQQAPDIENILSTSIDGYAYTSGTSFASPLAAGAASLLLAKRSDLYNDDIKNLLVISCDKLPEMLGADFTPQHGYGRINIKKALDLLQDPYVLENDLTSTGGTDVATGDFEKVAIIGVPGIGTGVYWVKKHEIRKAVNFSGFTGNINVWGRGAASNGWSQENPILGTKFCDVVPGTITSNSATLRTYIYEIWDLDYNHYYGYYPTTANNTVFAYTILGRATSFTVDLTSAQFPEGGGFGGTYEVNGQNVGGSFSGSAYYGQTINAIPPSGWAFYQWSDGNNSSPRILTANFAGYAIYKAIHKSNDANAFSNNGQRKLIETKTGTTTWLHQVYASLGHIWIEHSSDGGNSWTLGNNSQPLDGTAGGKNPSIAYINDSYNNYNYIGVVWQQPYSTTYKIQGMIFNQYAGSSNVPSPVTYVTTLHTEPSDAYSVNANPNLVLAGGAFGPYLVTFERKSTSGSWQPGINWLVGNITDSGSAWDGPFGNVESNGIVNGTNASTINTQISRDPGADGSNQLGVNFIRQQGSPGLIYSHYLYLIKSGNWQYLQSDDGMISYNASVNSSPSIVSLPNYIYGATWIEYGQMVYYSLNYLVRYYYGSSV